MKNPSEAPVTYDLLTRFSSRKARALWQKQDGRTLPERPTRDAVWGEIFNHAEKTQETDFTVRSHHFPIYRSLMAYQVVYGDKAAEEYAQQTVEKFVKVEPIDLYQADNYGTRKKEIRRVTNNTIEVYADFLGSSDARTVDLVEGKKDNICNTCPLVGDHCETRDVRRFGNYSSDALGTEQSYLNQFLSFADGDENTLYTESFSPVYFTDAPMSYGRVITTDMRSFRRFLRVTEFE